MIQQIFHPLIRPTSIEMIEMCGFSNEVAEVHKLNIKSTACTACVVERCGKCRTLVMCQGHGFQLQVLSDTRAMGLWWFVCRFGESWERAGKVLKSVIRMSRMIRCLMFPIMIHHVHSFLPSKRPIPHILHKGDKAMMVQWNAHMAHSQTHSGSQMDTLW